MTQTLGVDERDLLRRAYVAYFRSGGEYSMQPSGSLSDVEFHNGKAYVALRNGGGILAVYRVQNSGILKRLRRWPAALGE